MRGAAGAVIAVICTRNSRSAASARESASNRRTAGSWARTVTAIAAKATQPAPAITSDARRETMDMETLPFEPGRTA